MAHYIVSYDLHNQRTYPPVWKKLEGWGATRLLESLWVLTTTLTAVQIKDGLKAIIDSDDSVAVIEIKPASGWACTRAREAGVAWLRQNIAA
jgi:CRISPR associated protein Cas2 family